MTKKQFNKIAKILAIAARLDELQRLEGRIPSAILSRRRGILKKQLDKLTGESEENDTNIRIRISVPDETIESKKEKKLNFNLNKIIGGNFADVEFDDDNDNDNVFSSIKKLLPNRRGRGLGKVVTEI